MTEKINKNQKFTVKVVGYPNGRLIARGQYEKNMPCLDNMIPDW
jgi:hypothetical protein